MSVILLCGEDYYPARWDDFRGKFDTLDAAIASLNDSKDHEYEWYQLIHYETLMLLERGSWRAAWIPCPRCKGNGKEKRHVNEPNHHGIMSVTPVLIRCPECRGSLGRHGEYGWHKDED